MTIAMKEGSTLRYLHSDHLSSNTLVTNADGTVHSSQNYCAYGGKRTATWYGSECDPTAVNPLPTDRTYTGQEQDTTGLMFYHARFYDPALGTFISPDTLVPDAGVVFDYNRYMYVRGNALKYNDPSGHCPVCFGAGIGAVVNAGAYLLNESRQSDGIDLRIDISFKGGLNVGFGDDWMDLGVAVGQGAIAGALVVAAPNAGIGMAAEMIGDHLENAVVGEDFSAKEHIIDGVIGGLSGAGSPLVATASTRLAAQYTANRVTQEVVGFAARSLTDGLLSGTGSYVSSAIDGQASSGDFWQELPWSVAQTGMGSVIQIGSNSLSGTARSVYSLGLESSTNASERMTRDLWHMYRDEYLGN